MNSEKREQLTSVGPGAQIAHLDCLDLRLSNERARLAAATKPQEIAMRKVWVAQLEREIAAERSFTEVSMSDDELLAELGAAL